MAFMRLGKQHHDLVLTHDPNKEYTEKSNISGPVGISSLRIGMSK